MGVLTNLFIGSCVMYVDGVDVGWTRGGIRMRVNKSLWARPSLYGLGVDSVVKQAEDYYISTQLVETSMINFRKAWGINEAADRERLDFGGSVAIPTHTLRFVAGDGFFEAYFYKVIAVDFGEVSFTSKSDAAIPVTFRALLDTTKAVGAQVGYVIRPLSYSDLICYLSIPKIKRHAFFLRVRTLGQSSIGLVARVGVNWYDDTEEFFGRVEVRNNSSKNFTSRVTTRKETTKSLVGRVTVYYVVSSKNLVSQIAVRKQSSGDLVCRMTKVAA